MVVACVDVEVVEVVVVVMIVVAIVVGSLLAYPLHLKHQHLGAGYVQLTLPAYVLVGGAATGSRC